MWLRLFSAIGLDDFVDDDDPFAGWVFVSNNFVVNPAYASAEAQTITVHSIDNDTLE